MGFRRLHLPRALFGAFILLLLSAGLLSAGSAKESPRPQREPRRVVTGRAAFGPSRARFRAQGVTRARQHAELSFTLPGRLSSRLVQVGDRVSAGQLLARLDARSYGHGARAAEASARKAAAQLALNERDLARLDALASVRAISADQVDRIGGAVDAARASRDAADVQLEEAQRTLRETELRAPFAATVVAVHLEAGEFAAAGNPVIELSGEGGLEIEVDVPGRIASHLQPGNAAQVSFPLDPTLTASARIASISQSAAGRGRLFPVVVSVDAAGAQQGSAAQVILEFEAPPELTVPAAAVVAPAGIDASVFRVRAGQAERISVTLGHLSGARVAVVGQLAADDHLVTAGYTGLVHGERVIEVAP